MHPAVRCVLLAWIFLSGVGPAGAKPVHLVCSGWNWVPGPREIRLIEVKNHQAQLDFDEKRLTGIVSGDLRIESVSSTFVAAYGKSSGVLQNRNEFYIGGIDTTGRTVIFAVRRTGPPARTVISLLDLTCKTGLPGIEFFR